MSNERLRRGVGLGIFGVCLFATGEIAGSSQHPGLPALPGTRTVSLAADGGAGFPASLVTEEDLWPGGPERVLVCDGQSCRLPGLEPGAAEDRHDEVTYVADKGGSVTLDRSTLAASSCNEPATVLVEEFGQYTIVVEGERVERLDRDLRRGRIGRVDACMQETPSEDDAARGDSGFQIAHVRVFPAATTWHFDPKTSAFVRDDE